MRFTEDKPVAAGVDGSRFAVRAALWAAAEAFRRGTSLSLVHVFTVPRVGLPGLVGSIGQVRSGMAAQGHERLEAARAAVLARFPALMVETIAEEGYPVAVLLRHSQTACMLVLGSRGLGGFTGLIVGSTAVSLAARAHCPVVVVRGRTTVGAPPTEGPVVVGFDGSADSVAAMTLACDEAVLRATPVMVVHTDSELLAAAPKETALEQELAQWRGKHPEIEITGAVERGRPAETLLEYGDIAQLVVVGCRGRGGFLGMLLGSTSQALVVHATCPVAVVRH